MVDGAVLLEVAQVDVVVRDRHQPWSSRRVVEDLAFLGDEHVLRALARLGGGVLADRDMGNAVDHPDMRQDEERLPAAFALGPRSKTSPVLASSLRAIDSCHLCLSLVVVGVKLDAAECGIGGIQLTISLVVPGWRVSGSPNQCLWAQPGPWTWS